MLIVNTREIKYALFCRNEIKHRIFCTRIKALKTDAVVEGEFLFYCPKGAVKTGRI